MKDHFTWSGRLLFFLIALLLIYSLISCEKTETHGSSDSIPSVPEELYGSWKVQANQDDSIFISFNRKGLFILTVESYQIQKGGKRESYSNKAVPFSFKDDLLTLHHEGGTQTLKVLSLEKEQMTLEWETGNRDIFKKVNENVK